jgi:hypothetical protein
MKRLLVISGIVVAVVLLIVVVLPLFINVDSFRPDLEKKLSAALNRTVHIGKLDASILSGGASASEISIADDPAFNTGPFLNASSLKIGVELMPLIFSKQLKVTSITVQKPDITLLKNAAGKWNYSSLGGSTMAKPSTPASGKALDVSVDKFEIVDGAVRSGERAAVAEERLVGFQVAERAHDRTGTNRVAVEYRLGELHLVHAEIGDGGAERRVVHRDADHQAQGEDAVDDALAELGLRRELLVDMERLDVHGERAEQDIVHFRDRARPRMVEHPADGKFLEIQPRHLSPRDLALLARMDAGRPAIVSMPPQDEIPERERTTCARC